MQYSFSSKKFWKLSIFIGIFACISACGTGLSRTDALLCEKTPECIVDRITDNFGPVCDIGCAQLSLCCACLEELQCILVSEARCVSNVQGGGSVLVKEGCIEDTSRCAVDCDGVLFVE
jgi:hypothetical protein